MCVTLLLGRKHVDLFLHVCAMTCSCVWHDLFTCVTWFVHVCDTSSWAQTCKCFPACVCHDWLIFVSRLVHVWAMTRPCVFLCFLGAIMYIFPCMYVPWLVNVCDMTPSCVCHHNHLDVYLSVRAMTGSCAWHHSFMCVTWFVHAHDTSSWAQSCRYFPACVCYDSFMCVTWLIHVCGMIRSFCVNLLIRRNHLYFPACVCHDWFMCVTWLISYVSHDSFMRVPRLIYVCAMTCSCVRHDSLRFSFRAKSCMGWLRLLSSLKS